MDTQVAATGQAERRGSTVVDEHHVAQVSKRTDSKAYLGCSSPSSFRQRHRHPDVLQGLGVNVAGAPEDRAQGRTARILQCLCRGDGAGRAAEQHALQEEGHPAPGHHITVCLHGTGHLAVMCNLEYVCACGLQAKQTTWNSS